MKNKMILAAVTILLAFAATNANAQGCGHRGGGHYGGGYGRGYDRGYYGRGYNCGYDRGYYGRGYYRSGVVVGGGGYYAPGYYGPSVAVYPPAVPVPPVYAYRRPGYYVHPRPYFRGPRVSVNVGF